MMEFQKTFFVLCCESYIRSVREEAMSRNQQPDGIFLFAFGFFFSFSFWFAVMGYKV